jgi:Mrp family chromosome partitioning ATPase
VARSTTRRAESAAPRAVDPGLPISTAETARRIVTQLAYQQKLAVTSAVPGEGVSYTARALAATIAADMSARACVVDLNWWAAEGELAQRPRRSREVPTTAPAGPGIAAVLARDLPLEQALLSTDTPGLMVLPAGTLPVARRAAVARSSELKALIAELSGRFDYLVLDVPPVLQTSDAVVLAALAEGCCVVVRYGHTAIDQVQRALDDVHQLPILGVVINRSRVRTPRWLRAFITNE